MVTARMGAQSMTKQSDKTTSLKQNKINPATNELSEQDLNKVAGGVGPVDAARLPYGPIDGVKVAIGPVDGLKSPVGPIDGARLPLGPVDGRK